MKRLILVVALIMGMSGGIRAQVSLEEIIPMLETHLVKASFTCTIDSGTDVIYCGTAVAQDDCFVVKANGLENYCDGKKITVVDPECREVYIDSAVGLKDFLVGNANRIKNLNFSELRFLPKETDLSVFDYPTSDLGKEWVVTDIRQE